MHQEALSDVASCQEVSSIVKWCCAKLRMNTEVITISNNAEYMLRCTMVVSPVMTEGEPYQSSVCLFRCLIYYGPTLLINVSMAILIV